VHAEPVVHKKCNCMSSEDDSHMAELLMAYKIMCVTRLSINVYGFICLNF